MNVVWHDHEFVQLIFPLLAIVLLHFHHQFRVWRIAKYRYALPTYCRDKEHSLEGHGGKCYALAAAKSVTSGHSVAAALWKLRWWSRSLERRMRCPKVKPLGQRASGPKGFIRDRDAAMNGRSST
jgi:hypothetical protein